MLVGNAGIGKSALVRNKLECLPESYMTTKVPFNYYTTSLMLQSEYSCWNIFTSSLSELQHHLLVIKREKVILCSLFYLFNWDIVVFLSF